MIDIRAAGPMEQFEILPIIPLHFGNVDVSFTNSSLWMMIGTLAIIFFFFAATRRAGLIPSRMQSMAEVLYEFVSDLVRDTIGAEGRKFFPYVFTLFTFILVMNLFGLLPSLPGIAHEFHTFTPTSHLIVTLALGMTTITIVIVYGLWKNGWRFIKLFLPSGIPLWLMPLLFLIEIISFLSRPISLAVRLFANMFAGHIILKLFAGFVVSLIGTGSAVMLFGIAPFLGAIAVTMLEVLVSALQAYVFAVLTCIYLSDAAHAADH
ncbi:MAG: F0F1 ATP synthase subunit A [Alphaproteobacteria bacterium]|nr:F0F1 ATP synthase subunit A [Alphaproteobacteria bacterium]